MLNRRTLMAGAAALPAASLAAPALAQPAAARVIRYVPHANLPNVDPFTNTAFVGVRSASCIARMVAASGWVSIAK